MSTVFTKIIDGEDSRPLRLEGRAVRRLPVLPLSEGHLLLVPPRWGDRWPDLPAELAVHLFAVAHRFLVP